MKQDPQDIDHVLRGWEFEPGVVGARLVQASDGREVLQMRIEMGLLQMETANRPDGDRPGGAETYLDHLTQEVTKQGKDYQLTEEECLEVDREFLQYYHRRICWLALREFSQAVGDADHTIELMDFVRAHSPNEDWTLSHEQYRPFVLFQRTQAAALGQLEEAGAERAIEEINQGLDRIQKVFEAANTEDPFDADQMTGQLASLCDWVREKYDIKQTLSEQLADAVAAEQYELAAKIRDEIDRRRSQDE